MIGSVQSSVSILSGAKWLLRSRSAAAGFTALNIKLICYILERYIIELMSQQQTTNCSLPSSPAAISKQLIENKELR